ncbi:MAG TPA: methionyl-tRNA formyltransferase [Acidobacteriaceae bacterium]
MRLVFCGTPQFAVPTLHAVLQAGHEVSLVLTQPDRPGGRGMQLVTSAVKQAALAAGLAIEQPEKIRKNEALRERLEAIAPDAILVVAYGRIIPPWMLGLPRHGNLNLHGSMLPRYRGAAPIQWAVARGESVTGVTTMRLDEGLDTGDILQQNEFAIGPDKTAEDLYPPMAHMGAQLMLETLEELEAGRLAPRPQDHERATLAPILTREDGRMDFSRPARETYNRWRGFTPWPGAWSMFGQSKFTVSRMAPAAARHEVAAPGTLLVQAARLYLCCGDEGWVELVEVQLEGRRSMLAAEFLRGHPIPEGARLG